MFIKSHLDEFNKLMMDLILDVEEHGVLFLASLLESREHFIDSLLQECITIIWEEIKSTFFSKE